MNRTIQENQKLNKKIVISNYDLKKLMIKDKFLFKLSLNKLIISSLEDFKIKLTFILKFSIIEEYITSSTSSILGIKTNKGYIFIVNIKTSKILMKFKKNTSDKCFFNFSKFGNMLLLKNNASSLCLIYIYSCKKNIIKFNLKYPIAKAGFSKLEKYIYVSTLNKIFLILDMRTFSILSIIKHFRETIFEVLWSPNDYFINFLVLPNKLYIYNMTHKKVMKRLNIGKNFKHMIYYMASQSFNQNYNTKVLFVDNKFNIIRTCVNEKKLLNKKFQDKTSLNYFNKYCKYYFFNSVFFVRSSSSLIKIYKFKKKQKSDLFIINIQNLNSSNLYDKIQFKLAKYYVHMVKKINSHHKTFSINLSLNDYKCSCYTNQIATFSDIIIMDKLKFCIFSKIKKTVFLISSLSGFSSMLRCNSYVGKINNKYYLKPLNFIIFLSDQFLVLVDLKKISFVLNFYDANFIDFSISKLVKLPSFVNLKFRNDFNYCLILAKSNILYIYNLTNLKKALKIAINHKQRTEFYFFNQNNKILLLLDNMNYYILDYKLNSLRKFSIKTEIPLERISFSIDDKFSIMQFEGKKILITIYNLLK
ncbi:hypothetical protein BNATCHR192 (nucleomorph) [Bigelowiella natans]|uniref:Uncharacterized protein n=1 Tax=Bigelowiella natans TaxID=227086 RepID=Q3LWJ4_BIGNA|nr:hypothetical protein BNATCHR192 [Bigelowiella natans]ABA27172.1 hypothetical protein [Bigelowiella natans]